MAFGEDAGASDFDHAAELFGLADPFSDDPVPPTARELRIQLRREEAQAVPRLLLQAQATRDVTLLDMVIRMLQRVLDPMPESRDYACAGMHNLSIAYGLRFGWLGEADDLLRAVDAARSVVALMGSEVRPEHLDSLAAVLQRRFGVTGDLADLDESIEVSRMALAEGSGTDGGGSDGGHWSMLAGALLLRYEHAGQVTDLTAAIEVAETAIVRTPEGDPRRSIQESYLSRALLARYWLSRRPGDLDEATRLARSAVQRTGDDHPDRPTLLSNLAGLLRDRFGQSGVRADLDEAIEIMTAIVSATDKRDPELPYYLSNLGVVHRVRFEHDGDEADIEAAVTHGHAAMRIASPGLRGRPTVLADVSLALSERYYWSGERCDLDEATGIAREAVAALPRGDPEQAKYLHTLSSMLRSQYDHSGELDDLEEALAVGREAVRVALPDHAARGLYLSALSEAVRLRYDVTQRPEDLDEAIDLALTAVNVCPDGHLDRAHFLSVAGLFVTMRGALAGSVADLDQAVDLVRAALAAREPRNRNRPRTLSELGHVLLARYRLTGDRHDLDEAVTLSRQALADTPADNPITRAMCLYHLGEVLAARYAATGDAADADEAAAAFDGATRLPAAVPAHVASSALAAGRLAASRAQWQEAARGYADAIAVLPAVVGYGLSRRSQEHAIGQWAGIPLGAAAMAVAAGRPEQAVELLEAGRGLLLVQGMETRAGFDTVRDLAPELAERLAATAAAMRGGGEWEEQAPGDGNHVHRQRRRDLAEQWERAVAEARALPGLAGFLATPGVGRLQATAAAGPIAVVNASIRRCDALLVTRDGIRHVSLDTTADAVAERATAFLRAVLEPGEHLADHSTDTVVLDTLRWLWRVVARPVLAELDLLGRPTTGDLSRLWWCPTGPMTFLPLHAAQEDGVGGVLDRVISSYTPTIRALEHASATGPASSASDVLVVAQPGQGLAWAAEEAMAVGESFPQATVLSDAGATREATLAALPNATIAHFACHGVLDVDAPSTSGIRLHDGTMTVLDVSRLHLRRAELAYLSACSTAVGGTELADEAIHLTSALQLAGFRQVIGTLWPVPDLVAVQVAADVYTCLAARNGTSGPPPGAVALHQAVHDLRDSYPDRPFLWASYVHIGP